MVWLLTYTGPFIMPQLQPCRRAEAANLPLHLLTAILTVSKRACPGICVQEQEKKKVAYVGFLCAFYRYLMSKRTHWHKIHQASTCIHWDSSTCNCHRCSCSDAHKDEVSSRTHSDLELSVLFLIFSLPTPPNTYSLTCDILKHSRLRLT